MKEETTWTYASNQQPIHIASFWGVHEPNGHAVENCAMTGQEVMTKWQIILAPEA